MDPLPSLRACGHNQAYHPTVGAWPEQKLTREGRARSCDRRTHRKGKRPMRLRKRCAAWLGLAGACVFAIGCGSDVPDPESDANAAADNAPGGGGSPEPAAAGAAAPAVAANDAPKAEGATPAQGPQGGEAPKDQSKGQGDKSATSEMLALSGGPNAPPAAGGGGGSPPPAAPRWSRLHRGLRPPANGAAPPGPGAPRRGHRRQAVMGGQRWVQARPGCRVPERGRCGQDDG